jgi:hypothetical protein
MVNPTLLVESLLGVVLGFPRRPAESALPGPGRPRLMTVVAPGVLAACVLAEAVFLPVGIDDLDEGYFVQQAARVLEGQVPFRDFETFYTPGLVYLHAGLFAVLGGPSLVAPRVLALISRAALVFSLYGAARPLVRQPLWAALPGVFLLLALDDAPVRWEPHPAWPGTVFAVLAAWASGRGSLVLSGLAAGAAYLFKQNTGIFILAATLACGAFSPHQPINRLLVPVGAFAAVTMAWLVPLAFALGGDVLSLGPLVGAVNQAGLFSPPELSMTIPLAAGVAGLWLVRRAGDRRVLALLVSGLALFLTQYPRMDTLHLAWSAPVLLLVGAVALDRARRAVVILTLAGLGALAAPTVASRLEYISQPRAAIAGVEAPVQTAAEVASVIADVNGRAAVSEPIFVYPSSPLLYVLAGRPNPTRFDHLNPGAADARQVEAVITDLQAVRVRLVVISEYWRGVWGDPGLNTALEAYLQAHFSEAGRHGPYRVLVARL